MIPYLDDGDVQLYVGDSRDVLAELPEKSVHAVLTSPPFFGLRDYQTGTWEGGDPGCDHERPSTTMNVGFNERWGQGEGERRQERKSGGQYAGTCPKCGAVRVDRQIGLEASPDEWAASLVEVFAGCRRVLRDDGSLWVEVGDSYATTSTYNVAQTFAKEGEWRSEERRPSAGVPAGVKAKDLIGAPWLLAFALRADGWWLRGAYVWEKPDAMPESVRDRCTTSHSMLFHFAKSARYFFDRDAIREPFSDYSTGGDGGSYGGNADAARPANGRGPRGSTPYVRNRGGVPDGQVTLDGQEPEQEVVGPDGRTALHVEAQANSEQHRDGDRWPSLEGRSPRSVWRITTEANSFGLCPACRTFWPEKAPAKHCGVDVVAHFAVWPHKLVERIVNAATPEGGACGDCGAPRLRQTERPQAPDDLRRLYDRKSDFDPRAKGLGGQAHQDWLDANPPQTIGWEPTCECAAPSVPATVLDPFGGSGTTARQARKMGRRCILVELSPDYAEIASHRLSQLALPLSLERT